MIISHPTMQEKQISIVIYMIVEISACHIISIINVESRFFWRICLYSPTREWCNWFCNWKRKTKKTGPKMVIWLIIISICNCVYCINDCESKLNSVVKKDKTKKNHASFKFLCNIFFVHDAHEYTYTSICIR